MARRVTRRLAKVTRVTKLNPAKLADVQNKLAVALAKSAKDMKIAAKDWVQGGWERASDKVNVGLTKSMRPR